MAVFKWAQNALSDPVVFDYLRPANLIDLSTGTQGVTVPAAGDTTIVTAIPTPDFTFASQTKLFQFPITGSHTEILFYAPQGDYFQNNSLQMNNPNGLVGDTVQGQTLYIDSSAGAARLWMENSHLINDRILSTGTTDLLSSLDSAYTGSILVGRPGHPSFFEITVDPYDADGVKPTDHSPITTINASIDVGDGSTLWIESESAAGFFQSFDLAGTVNAGAITIRPGGSLVIQDTGDVGALSGSPNLVALASLRGMLFNNTGSVDIEGAAGKTTRAAIETNTIGPGSITVDGNGAPSSATSLLVDGSMAGQTIVLTDGTITFYDTISAINVASNSPGFDVTGGSFTFGDANGVLLLDQQTITAPTPSGEVATTRHPFSTPISGFRAGDVIGFIGRYPPNPVVTPYVALYDATTHVLSIDSQLYGASAPPLIIAQLTLVGTYDASGFRLVGNAATQELDLTYTGSAPTVANTPGVPVTGAMVTNATLNGSLSAASGVPVNGNPIFYEVDGNSTVQTLSLGYGIELDIGFSDPGALTGTGSINGPTDPAGGTLPLVDNFGTLDINGTIGTKLDNDGQLTVGAGEHLTVAGALYSGGNVTVAANGTLSLGGATSSLQHAADAGTIDITAGTLSLTGAMTGGGTIIVEPGATLDITGAGSVSTAVVLKAGSTLKTSHATSFTGTLLNPSTASTIVLTDSVANAVTVVNGQIVITTPSGPVGLNATGVATGSTPIVALTAARPAVASAPSASNPATATPAILAVYRFFDKVHGTHFFTADINERNATVALTSAYAEETNGFGAVASSDPTATAVYRFFDTRFGTHFFTASAQERATVQATRPDLTYEPGSTFYEHSTQQPGDVPVYRFFDSGSGTHFYTGDQSEYNAITTPGVAGYRIDLKSEGIGFYAPSGSFS